MNQSDYCLSCGGQKEVQVTLENGSLTVFMPGSAQVLEQRAVSSIETRCRQCGLVYSHQSLATPVVFYN